MSVRTTRRRFAVAAGLSAALLLTACTGNTAEEADDGDGDTTSNAGASSSNDDTGETVTIGFSAPAADHGWMAAITSLAVDEAEKYDDIDLRLADGTNDVALQISQMETFINDGVDAIVMLPFDGASLTPIALEAMAAGIPVINVDREFSDPNAARVTVLGDNYGMGVSAGEYMCERLEGESDPVIAEIAGIDNLPLTQDRSQGFEDALSECGLSVAHRVAAEFTAQSGETVTSSLLQALPEIDASWNHDDDQGLGVMAAIEIAGRAEFFMVGGAGSANAMRDIEAGDSVLEATVIYPASQAADGIRLARLLAQQKGMSDLVQVEVPRLVQLYAPVVTSENVDQYIDTAFES